MPPALVLARKAVLDENRPAGMTSEATEALLDRDAELAALGRTLDDARDRRGGLVIVEGEAGMRLFRPRSSSTSTILDDLDALDDLDVATDVATSRVAQ
jgi:hypothetical protein